MPHVQRRAPRAKCLVAGTTHPKVLATEGESYRDARIAQASRNGVAGSVHFDATYRDVPTLTALIQAASAVVLPYDSRDQATSGVLVDAIAAANSAWLQCAALAHNMIRWTAMLGGVRVDDRLIVARTVRTRLLAIAGRVVNRAGRPTLRLAINWPWAAQFTNALDTLRALHPSTG